MSQTYLFVGLGNPGPEYELTRHNMGYLVVQELASRLGSQLKQDRRFNAKVGKGLWENKNIHFLLPLTFMNLSGTAIKRYVDYFNIPLKGIMIVTDDVALPFGQLRVRAKGSPGGHNGLKSIEHWLGTSEYFRLKMGIGHPGEKMMVDYVLDKFNQMEQKELPIFIDRGVDLLQHLLKIGFENFSTVMQPVPRPPAKPIDLTKPPITG